MATFAGRIRKAFNSQPTQEVVDEVRLALAGSNIEVRIATASDDLDGDDPDNIVNRITAGGQQRRATRTVRRSARRFLATDRRSSGLRLQVEAERQDIQRRWERLTLWGVKSRPSTLASSRRPGAAASR